MLAIENAVRRIHNCFIGWEVIFYIIFKNENELILLMSHLVGLVYLTAHVLSFAKIRLLKINSSA